MALYKPDPEGEAAEGLNRSLDAASVSVSSVRGPATEAAGCASPPEPGPDSPTARARTHRLVRDSPEAAHPRERRRELTGGLGRLGSAWGGTKWTGGADQVAAPT